MAGYGRRRRERVDHENGFSLLEVLFATALLTVALTGLAQLFIVAARANASAKTTTYAAVLAQQKMEQLRGLAYGFDVLGLPVTDTNSDITVDPVRPAGGTGLQPSPVGALGENTVGYVDYLDSNGTSLGGAAAVPPPGAVYIRRWSVERIPANPNTIVLQVLVTRARNRAPADSPAGVVTRLPDEARIVSVKTRKAS